MKKTVLIIVLCFFTSGLLCAQDQNPAPRLSMWNRGVFDFDIKNLTSSAGPNWMGGGNGVYNSLSLDWAWKDVSWTMTGQWDGDAWNNKVNLRDYSGTFAMFSRHLFVMAGKVRSDGGYRFANFDTSGFSTRIADAEPGFMLRVLPIRSLSVGAFLPVPIASQALAATFGNMNFGLDWVMDGIADIKASFRMEKDLSGNREIAVGASLLAVQGLGLTLGYRYLDFDAEHDIFLDASYRLSNLVMHGFGDLNFQGGDILYGAKLNLEYEFPKTPFLAGASASYGNGDVWWNDGLAASLYGRYSFAGGSSVQVGTNGTYDFGTSVYDYGAELQYTISL